MSGTSPTVRKKHPSHGEIICESAPSHITTRSNSPDILTAPSRTDRLRRFASREFYSPAVTPPKGSERSARTSPASASPYESRPRKQSLTSSISDRIKGSFEQISVHNIRTAIRERSKEGRAKANSLNKGAASKLLKFWECVDPNDSQQLTNEQSLPQQHFTEAEFYTNSRVRRRHPPFGSCPNTSRRPRLVSTRSSLDIFDMDLSRLSAPSTSVLADQQDKARRVKDAQEVYQTILRNAQKSNTQVPPYDFLELIGKGAFGRVYKCRDQRSGDLVAVKILNIDDQDWTSGFAAQDARDDTIKDFRKEVGILQQLKDNNVKNVNVIHDAFDLHSQLWMVSDYCTGGSVRTLLRPFEKNGRPAGFPVDMIIPIARELAVAVHAIHEMHIIHRDIKCANVYITEDGDIQLGDFGIVAVMDDGASKRKTVIGTPHWMAEEMLVALESGTTTKGYGTEIDIWSYGCTVWEMATGTPPNANIHPEYVGDALADGTPRLTGDEYPEMLRDFIAFCLNPDAKTRPTAAAVLDHPFIADTSESHPTSSLIPLIERFKLWEHGGGSRASLWIAGPADPRVYANDADTPDNGDDDSFGNWNFSTSDNFDQAFGRRFSQLSSVDNDDKLHGSDRSPALPPLTTNLSVAERIKREHTELSANRGEQSLARLYDPHDPSGYQLATPISAPSAPPSPPPSDLPLRNFTSGAPTRESMIEIDLNEAEVDETATSTFALHMEAINEHTVKPANRHALHDEDEDDDGYTYSRREDDDKRATLEWTFPTTKTTTTTTALPPIKRGTMDWTFTTAEARDPDESDFSMDFKPQLKHSATEPVGQFPTFSHVAGNSAPSPIRESIGSMIDLDMSFADSSQTRRPSTASSMAGSTMTDMTSGNPFDLEDDQEDQHEVDRSRFSYHKQWQSDGGHPKRSSHKTMQMHARGSSLSSTGSDRLSDSFQDAPYMQPFGLDQPFSHDNPTSTQWPNFDEYETSPQMPNIVDIPRLGAPSFPLEGGLQIDLPPTGPEVSFPHISAPHPDALVEEADQNLLYDELGRMLENLGHALDSTHQALTRSVDDDGDSSSNVDGGYMSSDGFESMREEEEGTPDFSDQLTARRKPRKIEIRSPGQGSP